MRGSIYDEIVLDFPEKLADEAVCKLQEIMKRIG